VYRKAINPKRALSFLVTAGGPLLCVDHHLYPGRCV